eukprot:11160939-Ditylum_brightwellii.AAC.1
MTETRKVKADVVAEEKTVYITNTQGNTETSDTNDKQIITKLIQVKETYEHIPLLLPTTLSLSTKLDNTVQKLETFVLEEGVIQF